VIREAAKVAGLFLFLVFMVASLYAGIVVAAALGNVL
jgi:hypothetical protein